jgi:putative transposase
MATRAYATDLTDEGWKIVASYVEPIPGQPGHPREVDTRAVVNAILYLNRTGCQWRLLPHDFPDYPTVYYYFSKWKKNGVWLRVHEALRQQVRDQEKPDNPGKTLSIDSQSAKSAGAQEEVGFDKGKLVHGRKRHIIVDSLGMILAILVLSASVTDATAAKLLLAQIQADSYSHYKTIFADSAYNKSGFPLDVQQQGRELVIIRHKRKPKGWKLLPRRWVVERTFGWLTRCRRLCRSYEHTASSEEAMIRVSMISLMSRRLTKQKEEFFYQRPIKNNC